MEKKKIRTKKRKSSFLLALGFCVLAGAVAIKLVQLQIDINDSKQVYSEKVVSKQQLIDENNELDDVLTDEEKFAEYMERAARKEGYINPGERVYYDISFGG